MENKDLKKQIALLKKYGITNYTIKDDVITINGSLYLSGLPNVKKDILNKNVKQLKSGYNEKGNYCFYDGILRKVLKVSFRKEFTIYTTPIDFVLQNGKHTAHGKTVKQAIKDCLFKAISENIKNDQL